MTNVIHPTEKLYFYEVPRYNEKNEKRSRKEKEMSGKAIVAHANLNPYERTIVVSDIHGDNQGFLETMRQVGFSPQDALVIVGDLLEKGEHSLELLHTVMRCAQAGNVYMVAGNNDTIFSEWYNDEVTDEEVHDYMNHRKNIILREMALEMGMSWQTLEEVRALKAAVPKCYAAELDFLNSLPHILETEHFIFVHAGLKPGPLTEQDRDFCLTAKAFGTQLYRFEKPLIVGHWPASNYCETIINVNPYFNRDTNVISIDSGNGLNRWHQINYLILHREHIDFGAYDDLPRFRALDSQKPSKDPLTLGFPSTEAEVIRKGETESICYLPAIDLEMPVANNQLYNYKGKRYCYNMTTYCLPVQAGEILACCDVEPRGLLAKRNGIVGYYTGRYEFLSSDDLLLKKEEKQS